MDSMENPTNGRVSHLRPPSKIPPVGQSLSEITASAENARASSMMPPPDRSTLKHKTSAIAEPAPKRKTLTERAGMTAKLHQGPPPSTRNGIPAMNRGTATLPRKLPSSALASASAQTPSTASRTHPSVGMGSRQQTTPSSSRPASAMGNYHAPSDSSVPAARPASVLGTNPAANGRQGLGKRKAWDTKGRLEDVELFCSDLQEKLNGSMRERNGLEETASQYRSRINELEASQTHLTASNASLQTELESTKSRLTTSTNTLDDERRRYRRDQDDLVRQHRQQFESAEQQAKDNEYRLKKAHADEVSDLRKRAKDEVDEERSQRVKEVKTLTSQAALDRQKAQIELDMKDREARNLRSELDQADGNLAQEKLMNQSLRGSLADATSNNLTLESSLRAANLRVSDLENDVCTHVARIDELQQQLEAASREIAEAHDKLRNEESLRRKLHNQVQELKGNIRVFCRVRPSLESEPPEDGARIAFPDTDKDRKEIEILGPEERSSLGTVSTKRSAFSFDRVFSPCSRNEEVFEEISQLVQSALDGYNVCIFCYGQTGSGKTYTMSADDGMIPRTVHQIYDTTQRLREKGWRYSMEGSFVEVYNENLNDLLGRAEDFDKKKHEIRHDLQRSRTHVSDLSVETLDSPAKVESILRRASGNRSVAATKANERSSRSHSVFILRLTGDNQTTGERSEGTLNLVDLAGSERLSHSGSTGERLKETQNINRSLSCLGDVIGALGQGREGGHVPYRNSKLTYLLQFSLGGNSKTLMFVMVSPLQAHLSETLTSLKFATKVHNTHIGTAKRQTRTKDSSFASSSSTTTTSSSS